MKNERLDEIDKRRQQIDIKITKIEYQALLGFRGFTQEEGKIIEELEQELETLNEERKKLLVEIIIEERGK